MLHNLVVGTFLKEHARTIIETHFFQPLLGYEKRNRGEEMIGEDGGYNGAHYFPTTLHCHY